MRVLQKEEEKGAGFCTISSLSPSQRVEREGEQTGRREESSSSCRQREKRREYVRRGVRGGNVEVDTEMQ